MFLSPRSYWLQLKNRLQATFAFCRPSNVTAAWQRIVPSNKRRGGRRSRHWIDGWWSTVHQTRQRRTYRLGLEQLETRCVLDVGLTGGGSVIVGDNVGIGFYSTTPATTPGLTVTGWTDNWDDGTINSFDGSASGDTHAYSPTAIGQHSVSATATLEDEDGNVTTESNSITVYVTAPPPPSNVIVTTDQASCTEGTVANYSASYFDAYPNLGITLAWTVSDVNGNPVATGNGTTFAFTPSLKGSYTTRCTVIDSFNQSASGSMTLWVYDRPPSISNLSNATINEGSAATFTGSVSDPDTEDNSNLSVTADWKDGSPTETVPLYGGTFSVSHIYQDDGTYIPVLTVFSGAASTSTAAIVTVNNVAPTLGTSGPSNISASQQYMLNFSSSDPGSDTIATWYVTWGDGSLTEQFPGNANSAAHMFIPGNYSITVAVYDEDGSYLMPGSQNVVVSSVPQTVTISGDSTVDEASPVTLNLHAENGSGTISSWLINWGDGGSAEAVSGNPSSVTHIYARGPQSYLVHATAFDPYGSYDAEAKAIYVNHVAPTLGISGNDTAGVNKSYLLLLSSSVVGSHPLQSWTINWGDGGTPETYWGNPSGVTHQYPAAGNFAITATVSDDVGSFAVGNSVSVAVNVVPQTVAISGPDWVNQGSVYTLSMSAADGSGTPSNWSINWGDNTAVSNLPGNSTSADHIYAYGPSQALIFGTVTDEFGSYDAAPLGVTVYNVSPTVTLTGSAVSNQGTIYTLSLHHFDTGNHPVELWRIKWGDSEEIVYGDVTSLTHVYAEAGSYTITAAATEPDGTVGTNSLAVLVAPVVITLGGDPTTADASTYTLNFSAVDPAGSPISWRVFWGDGGTSFLGSSATSATHTFPAGPGTYPITVVLGDEHGEYTSDPLSVSVFAAPPVLAISGNSSVDEGLPYALTLQGNNISGTISSWLINWGDGGPDETITGNPNAALHTYVNGPSSYVIEARATNQFGTYYAGSQSISVNNANPTLSNLTLSQSSIDEGGSVTLTGNISDTGVLDSFTLLIVWGDGTDQETVTCPAGTTSFSLPHTYADDNPPGFSDVMTIQVTLQDNDGGSTQGSTYLTVNNVAPTLSNVAFDQSTINEGDSATVRGNISDVGIKDSFLLVLNWGDGSSPEQLALPAGTTSFEKTHLYADNTNGAANVTVELDDDDNGVAQTSLALLVTNVAPSLTLSTSNSPLAAQPLILNGAISDPGSQDSFTLTVTWGDGQSNTYNYPAGTSTFAETHQYADPPLGFNATYTINATVTDKDSASGSASTTVSTPDGWWLGSYSYAAILVNQNSSPTGNERVSGVVDDSYEGWRDADLADLNVNADQGVLKNDNLEVEEEMHITGEQYRLVLVPGTDGLREPPDGHSLGDEWWVDTDRYEWQTKPNGSSGVTLVVIDKSPELDSVTLNNDGSFTATLKADDDLPEGFDGNVSFRYRVESGSTSTSTSGSDSNEATVSLEYNKIIFISTDSNNDGPVDDRDKFDENKRTGTGAYLQVDNAASETTDLTKVKVRPGLQEVRIDGPGITLQTTVTVSVLNGGNKVQLWTDERGTEPMTNLTWQVGSNQPVQKTFYVEAKDVGQIDLQVVRGNPMSVSKSDQVRLTAVKVDVDVVGDNSQPLTELLDADPVQLDGIVPRFAQGGEQPALTPVRVQLNIPGNAAAQATIDFDSAALGIYKNADESGGILSSGDTLPLQNGVTTLYVGHWLDDPTTAQQQSIKVKWVSSNGSKTFTDEINVAPVVLQVTKVPDYLFGGATYATPITFQVKGVDKIQVGQSGPTINMYNSAAGGGDPILEYNPGADSRWTKSTPDGKSFGSQSTGNGESSSYTVFIATSQIGALDGTAKKPDNSTPTYFQAIVDASLSSTRLQTLHLKSANYSGSGSDSYVSKKYYDSSVPTVEFTNQDDPHWFNTTTVPTGTRSTKIYANGEYQKRITVITGDDDASVSHEWRNLTRQGDVPHEVASIEESMSLIKSASSNFDNSGNFDGFNTLYVTSGGLSDEAVGLGDDVEPQPFFPPLSTDPVYHAGGVGVSLTSASDTISANVYVSYGGISVPGILAAGEKAMDLGKTDGALHLSLMPDSTFTANTSAATGKAGVYPAKSAFFSAAWALSPLLPGAAVGIPQAVGIVAGLAAAASTIAEAAAANAPVNSNDTKVEAGYLLDHKQYTPEGINLPGGHLTGNSWGGTNNGGMDSSGTIANLGFDGQVSVGQQISAAFTTYAIVQAKSAFEDQSVNVNASIVMSQLPNSIGPNGSQLGLNNFRVIAY
jgi:hypothetical protein